MADSTTATKDLDNWIRNEFLSKKYHQIFSKRKLGVQSGGEFECDAVSEDGKIVCFISTSVSTATGENPGLAKIRELLFGQCRSMRNRIPLCLHAQRNPWSSLSKKNKPLDDFPSILKHCW